MFVVQYVDSSRSWTSCSHSSKPGVDSRGRAEPHLAIIVLVEKSLPHPPDHPQRWVFL